MTPSRTIVALFSLTLAWSSSALGDGLRAFPSIERPTLGTDTNLSASVRIADLDGDGDSDVVIANGRHWPQQNFVLLNQGGARFNVQRDLGEARSTSYATEVADLDGDGDLDIAVGNDRAPNRIFLNDGAGRLVEGGTFGEISSVRSLTLADIDGDKDIDILATSRGMPNLFYLNDGKGGFGAGRPYGSSDDSTIDVAVGDLNLDGHADLVLANRDGQQNTILLGDSDLSFSQRPPFGTGKDQTRAVAIADLDGDGLPDWVAGNIEQPNVVYFGDGKGGVRATVEFGRKDGRTFALAVADLNNDGTPDIIAGNTGQENAVFFNLGAKTAFQKVNFGDKTGVTYGVATGDLNGDGFLDIAIANSGSLNRIFISRPPPTDWPSFRGPGGGGVATGFAVRSQWNADAEAGELKGILWRIDVPGLGHSSPVVHGDKIFLATAVAADGDAPLMVGPGGRPGAADDNGEQSWVVLCYDRLTGKELWRKTAHKGIPRASRHAKATHANSTVTVSGNRVVAFFGSEGLHCYDLDGNLKWSRDLGVINISKYGIGWGYASSPAIHGNRIVLVCDDPGNPFLVALSLSDGKELWRVSRKDVGERNWATPFIHHQADRTQIVVNGWPWIVSYKLETGDELWRIRGGGDNPVPTPFMAHGWIYITNAHGGQSPIFVVRPEASGDISITAERPTNKAVVWNTNKGGSYMSTPVVLGDYLYLGNTNGVIRCFHAKTGEKIYEDRLDSGAGIIASLVAADGKIFAASENGTVYSLAAGPEFKILARNAMGEPCFATPAVSQGTLYIRTTRSLVAIPGSRAPAASDHP